jgi:hypothetical protein
MGTARGLGHAHVVGSRERCQPGTEAGELPVAGAALVIRLVLLWDRRLCKDRRPRIRRRARRLRRSGESSWWRHRRAGVA